MNAQDTTSGMTYEEFKRLSSGLVTLFDGVMTADMIRITVVLLASQTMAGVTTEDEMHEAIQGMTEVLVNSFGSSCQALFSLRGAVGRGSATLQ